IRASGGKPFGAPVWVGVFCTLARPMAMGNGRRLKPCGTCGCLFISNVDRSDHRRWPGGHMSIVSRTWSVMRNVVRRAHTERQLDEEMSAYVDLLTDELMRTGLSADEARRAANLKIGGFANAKDQVRDERPGMMLEHASRDLRFGLRLLRRSPGFATVA